MSANLCDSYRGQSYKDFYTLGQIYKPVLKHENMTLNPDIFEGLHFSFSLTWQFRHFILHRPKVQKMLLDWPQNSCTNFSGIKEAIQLLVES